MDYTLAKELKDAGFPNMEFGPLYVGKVILPQGGSNQDNPSIPIPTLEELIEACAKEFSNLKLYPNRIDSKLRGDWMAWGIRETTDKLGYGFNPDEAIARLWLALNRKD